MWRLQRGGISNSKPLHDGRRIKPVRTCLIEGCERKHKGRGYCDPHLQRVKKFGAPIVDVPIGQGKQLVGDQTEQLASDSVFPEDIQDIIDQQALAAAYG